jgi:hypothetical protein
MRSRLMRAERWPRRRSCPSEPVPARREPLVLVGLGPVRRGYVASQVLRLPGDGAASPLMLGRRWLRTRSMHRLMPRSCSAWASRSRSSIVPRARVDRPVVSDGVPSVVRAPRRTRRPAPHKSRGRRTRAGRETGPVDRSEGAKHRRLEVGHEPAVRLSSALPPVRPRMVGRRVTAGIQPWSSRAAARRSSPRRRAVRLRGRGSTRSRPSRAGGGRRPGR